MTRQESTWQKKVHHGITVDALHHSFEGVHDALSLQVLQPMQTDSHLTEHIDTVELYEDIVLVQVIDESL